MESMHRGIKRAEEVLSESLNNVEEASKLLETRRTSRDGQLDRSALLPEEVSLDNLYGALRRAQQRMSRVAELLSDDHQSCRFCGFPLIANSSQELFDLLSTHECLERNYQLNRLSVEVGMNEPSGSGLPQEVDRQPLCHDWT
jgi:hypothetical protein